MRSIDLGGTDIFGVLMVQKEQEDFQGKEGRQEEGVSIIYGIDFHYLFFQFFFRVFVQYINGYMLL